MPEAAAAAPPLNRDGLDERVVAGLDVVHQPHAVVVVVRGLDAELGAVAGVLDLEAGEVEPGGYGGYGGRRGGDQKP